MLSGGQRQRVAIGRAMVREPVAYLMDEPLSNLDAKLRVSMRAELARLHDRLGVTTIYVTHDQVEAMTLGDRVCVLHEGEILQVDTPDRLFNAPADTLVASFIGSPAMNLAVADVEGGQLRFGQHHIELTADLRDRIGERRRVVIGLRPTDFRVRAADLDRDDGRGSRVIRLPAVAEVVERLGAEQLVVFPVDVPRYQVGQLATAADDDTLLSDPDTSRFTARLDMRRPIARGENIDLWFDLDRLYLFDEATGLALDEVAVQGSSTGSEQTAVVPAGAVPGPPQG
jgi:multiple sugar transport system ATP-binding protein